MISKRLVVFVSSLIIIACILLVIFCRKNEVKSNKQLWSKRIQRILPEEASLQELKDYTIFIDYEYNEDEDEPNVLDKKALENDMELLLYRAEIDFQKRSKGNQEPFILMTVNTIKAPEFPIYAFSIKLELFQEVTLIRNRNIITTTPTWRDESVGIAGKLKLDEAIRGGLQKLQANFIYDYLTVNYKQKISQ